MDNEHTNGWPEIRQKDMGVAILSKKTPINKIIYNFTHSYVQKAYPNK
jgi:hypothetical protein